MADANSSSATSPNATSSNAIFPDANSPHVNSSARRGWRARLKSLWAWQKQNPWFLHKIALFVAGLLLITHLTTLASLLINYSDPIGTVNSFDPDGGFGIEISKKTWLIGHNGSTLYGPVYYRLGALVHRLMSFNYNVQDPMAADTGADGNFERSVHFHMLLINLLSIYGAFFLICWCLTASRFFQIMGTVVLVSLCLRNEWRSGILFFVKPDHLFAMTMTIAGYYTLRWLSLGTRSSLKWMSAAWALAASTKLSVIFFIPALVVLFFGFEWLAKAKSLNTKSEWLDLSKSFARRFWFFILCTSLLYMVIGFPQNLDVGGYISYLLRQSESTSPVDWAFLKDKWLYYFGLDLLYPLLGLFVLAMLLPLRKATDFQIRKSHLWLFFIFMIVACGFLFSKKTIAPFEWYSFPFINMFWLLFVFAALYFSDRFSLAKLSLMGVRFSAIKRHELFPFLFLLILAIPASLVKDFMFPQETFAAFKRGVACRTEAKAFQHKIDSLAATGKTILADPYIPADFEMNRKSKKVRGEWQMSQEKLKELNPDYIALNEKFYNVFLPTELGGPGAPITYMKDTTEAVNFYLLFFKNSEATDRFGQTWKKIHQDACKFELWEKQP